MCETSDESVVFGRQICFSYTKSEPILKGIDLTVKKGTIYGLLGSSGCGKTTLLKCILGRLQQKSGEIQVFGLKPGSPESHIPGGGVGYMPQELALLFEFTTEEILTYFGRIYGMKSNEIKDKIEKLIKLLELKNKNKLIANQSGGQQRRISLACTLIHSPPLLILDEPTVGTDPVLRQSIWIHLMDLCQSGHTIILTTHYIDESRNANTVAFMRSGKILAEDDPNLLLNKYETNNLEDVFLKLCHSESGDSESLDSQSVCENQINSQKDEIPANNYESNIITISAKKLKDNQDLNNGDVTVDIEPNNNKVIPSIKLNQVNDCTDVKVMITHPQSEAIISVRNSSFKQKCSALLLKNYIRITRNWAHLLFELIFTSLLTVIVLISIGEGPTGIDLAIWDEEMLNNKSLQWGQLFVEHIDRNIFNIHYYDTIDEAIDSVYEGQNTAAIEINDRLSSALQLRFLYFNEAHEDTIDESQMYVHIDRSDPIIGLQIERYLYISYLKFVHDMANKTNINTNLLKIPLIFEEPIYGDNRGSLRDFATPGNYIALTFYVTTIITAHMVIEERADGIFERSFVAGITAFEFILSNIITQFFIVCFQIVFLLILPYIVLGQQISGSIVLFVSLLFVQGFCGVTFGLSIAIIFPKIIIAALVLTCWFITSIATAGVIWPVKNMPAILQLMTRYLPNTIAVQSLRDIMYRQWTIDYTEVYMGFVMSFVWIFVFLLTAIIILRKKG